jgi:hypothetical protein
MLLVLAHPFVVPFAVSKSIFDAHPNCPHFYFLSSLSRWRRLDSLFSLTRSARTCSDLFQRFLDKQLMRCAYMEKSRLEAVAAQRETAVAQRLVDEGRREQDAKRSMVRHVSHEIRYVRMSSSFVRYIFCIIVYCFRHRLTPFSSVV